MSSDETTTASEKAIEETARELRDWNVVNDYIFALQWSEGFGRDRMTGEDAITLVDGNLRAFYGHLLGGLIGDLQKERDAARAWRREAESKVVMVQGENADLRARLAATEAQLAAAREDVERLRKALDESRGRMSVAYEQVNCGQEFRAMRTLSAAGKRIDEALARTEARDA